MKKVLFCVFAVIIVGNCIGQKKDSIDILRDATNGQDIYMLIKPPTRQDTIPVIMLVGDTLDRKDYGFSFLEFNKDGKLVEKIGDSVVFKDYSVWWQFGYEVSPIIDENSWEYWLINYKTEYLDQNKKPLPKSIIVWMTKEIKP